MVTIALSVLGGAVMLALGGTLSRERRRPVWGLLVPPAITFLVVAPVVYRSASGSAGDASLMIGVVIGAVIGVWRGKELTPVGVPRGSAAIVVGGDRWGAYALAVALVLDGVLAAGTGDESIAPLIGLVGATAGQLIGWHVGVYGRVRAERTVPSP